MRKTLMLGTAALAIAIAAPSYADQPLAGSNDIILAQDRTAPGTPGTTPRGPSAADKRAEEAARERIQRLEAAQPATQAHLSADTVIGTEIRNVADKKLGSVKDLVMADGKIVAVIVARGGVLGMGTSYHQIELAQVKVTADAKTVVIDLGEEQVKALPKVAFADGKWSQVAAEKDVSPPSTAPAAPPSRGEPPKTEKQIDPSTPPANRTEPPAKSE